jgi:hypothetical protein
VGGREDAAEASRGPGVSDWTFRKLHLNAPGDADGEDQLVSRAQWERLEDATVKLPTLSKLTVGIESSFGRRTAALAAAHLRGDETIAIWCRTWGADGVTAASVRLPDGQVDHTLIQQTLDDLINSFEVERVVYDPAFVFVDAERLRELGVDVVELPNGSEAQRQANRFLYELIDQRRLVHAGEPSLAEHVTNVRAELDAHGRMAIYRRRQERRADGWFALAAAVSQFEGADADDYFYDPVATGVWDEVLRGPWRDRGVDEAAAHAVTNVVPGQPLSSLPGSTLQGYESRPPIGPPSDTTTSNECGAGRGCKMRASTTATLRLIAARSGATSEDHAFSPHRSPDIHH